MWRKVRYYLTIKIEHDELSRISTERGVSIDNIRREITSSWDSFLPNEEWTF